MMRMVVCVDSRTVARLLSAAVARLLHRLSWLLCRLSAAYRTSQRLCHSLLKVLRLGTLR